MCRLLYSGEKQLFPFLIGAYKSVLPTTLRSAAVMWEADGKKIPQKAHRPPDIKALETTHSNIPASRLETCRPAPKAPGEERLPVLHHLYFTSIKSGTGQISDEEQMSTIANEPLWKQDIPEPSAQWAVKSHIKKKPIGGRCGISAAYQIQLPDYFDTSVGASERWLHNSSSDKNKETLFSVCCEAIMAKMASDKCSAHSHVIYCRSSTRSKLASAGLLADCKNISCTQHRVEALHFFSAWRDKTCSLLCEQGQNKKPPCPLSVSHCLSHEHMLSTPIVDWGLSNQTGEKRTRGLGVKNR